MALPQVVHGYLAESTIKHGFHTASMLDTQPTSAEHRHALGITQMQDTLYGKVILQQEDVARITYSFIAIAVFNIKPVNARLVQARQ
jgi:hypothetical protein